MRTATLAFTLTLALSTLAFSPLGLAATARAQDMAGLSSIYGAGVFRQAVIAVAPTALRAAGPNRETITTASQTPVPDFAFQRSERVDAAARQRLLDSLLATTTDPAAQAEIRDSVTSDAVWSKFDSVLSMAGYSASNLADVTAAYYIITWEVVSGGDAILHPAGVRAVRDAVAAALASNPGLATMSDADMQETAVIMAYKATVAGSAARRLAKAGDEAGLARLRDAVHRSVLTHGIDLSGLRLTERGLNPR